MAPRDVQLILARRSPSEEEGASEEVRLLVEYLEEVDFMSSKISGNLERIQVIVTGMTCAGCSNSVEAALLGVNGVVKASVALLQNRADVVFDPSLVKVKSHCIRLLRFVNPTIIYSGHDDNDSTTVRSTRGRRDAGAPIRFGGGSSTLGGRPSTFGGRLSAYGRVHLSRNFQEMQSLKIIGQQSKLLPF